jgi:hypothetical protein
MVLQLTACGNCYVHMTYILRVQSPEPFWPTECGKEHSK